MGILWKHCNWRGVTKFIAKGRGERESENRPKMTSVRAWQDFSLYPAGLQIRLTPELISVLPPSHAQHNILLMQWKHFLIINCLQKEKHIIGSRDQASDTKPFDQQNTNHLENTTKPQDSGWAVRFAGKFVTMFGLQIEDNISFSILQLIHSVNLSNL